MKKILTKFIILIIFLFFILYPQQAFVAAGNGIMLWFNRVLPCLLPFCIISSLMFRTNLMPNVNPIWLLLICGTCFGFPVAAKLGADMVNHDMLSSRQAEKIIPFCNHFSPAFLSGYIITQCLQRPDLTIPAYFLLYGTSAVILLCLNRSELLMRKEKMKRQDLSANHMSFTFEALDNAIMNGFETMVKLCGYLMFFSLLSGILEHLFTGAACLKALAVSTLEITTGIPLLTKLPLCEKLLVPAVMSFTAFGGISGLAQTTGFYKNAGLSMKKYFRYKASAAAVTGIITYLFLCLTR